MAAERLRERRLLTMKIQRVIVTGGPGAGKTTLLRTIAARGYACMPDNARAIIRDRKEKGLCPRPPAAEFAQQVLRLDIDCYRAAQSSEKYVFFERGIPDALCALDQLGVLSPIDATRYLEAYIYFPAVFVLPPWEQIYCTDSERDEDFVHSNRVHDQILKWYVQCGYDVVAVPRVPVSERTRFLLATLDRYERDHP